MFDFKETKEKIVGIEDWLIKELSLIRTGRATPMILDALQIDAYGGKMGIRELANITIEDAKTIRVEPWDMNVGKSIEKAIIFSKLGLSTASYEKGLRIIFPDLTSERREQLIKVMKGKLEEARVSLRGVRDKTWNEIQEKEKQGGMGEDIKFRLKEDMQKMIDEVNSKLDAMAAKKESEISL